MKTILFFARSLFRISNPNNIQVLRFVFLADYKFVYTASTLEIAKRRLNEPVVIFMHRLVAVPLLLFRVGAINQ